MQNKWRCKYHGYTYIKYDEELYPTDIGDRYISFAVDVTGMGTIRVLNYAKVFFEEVPIEFQYTPSQEGDTDDDI